jgi:hypothetical protein
MNNKEFVTQFISHGTPFGERTAKKSFNLIYQEIVDFNKDIECISFQQMLHNWLNDITEIPKCPLTNRDVKFNPYKGKYETYRGKGKRGKETQDIITKKRLETVNYKQLYKDKKNIQPTKTSFKNIKKLILDEFLPIDNFGGFYVKFLSRYPETFNYVESDDFLSDSQNFQEKIYRIINDLEVAPVCEVDCKSKCNFLGFTKGYSKYNNQNYRLARKSARLKILDNITTSHDKQKTIDEIRNQIEILEKDNKTKQNLYQCFFSYDPILVKSIFKHTEEFPDIKFSNRVFLLLNGEPVPDKGYIKPVFFSLDKGYSMRFSSQCGTSKREQELFDWLNEYIPNLKKDRSVLNGKEIDVFSEENNIGIEYDGVYWHNYEIVGDKSLFLKNQLATSKNVRLLHIFETEWLQKQDIIKSIILSKFNIFENKYYARKCDIRTVDSKICVDFLNENHLQGKDNSKYKYGLYYNDELVSVMTFGQRTITKNPQMELIRFCNKKNTTVIGGAGKLFNHFIKTHDPAYVKTYANARISDGDMYKKLGFSFKHHSPPNYWYYKPEAPKKIKLMHRSGFQKHRLSGILERFDKGKTEWENMSDHGYKKIYDCGNLVFEYQRKI